jgi:hypothetical protein
MGAAQKLYEKYDSLADPASSGVVNGQSLKDYDILI